LLRCRHSLGEELFHLLAAGLDHTVVTAFIEDVRLDVVQGAPVLLVELLTKAGICQESLRTCMVFNLFMQIRSGLNICQNFYFILIGGDQRDSLVVTRRWQTLFLLPFILDKAGGLGPATFLLLGLLRCSH